jgi:hypothetical protein
MIRNEVFMRIVDYNRQKLHITVQRYCDDIGIDKKDYDYYLKGVKTPPAGFVLECVRYFGLDNF